MKQLILKKLSLFQLCFILFNLSEINKNCIEIKFKINDSKYCSYSMDKDNIERLLSQFNEYTKMDFQSKNKEFKLNFTLDKKYEYDALFKEIYDLVQINISEYEYQSWKNEIMLAFLAFRGSIDFKLQKISVDIKRKIESDFYLGKILLLLSQTCNLDSININFRELQRDYIEKNRKRNTQIRIHLGYLIYDMKILEQLKEINFYKYDILNQNKNMILDTEIKPKESIFLKFEKYRNVMNIHNLDEKKEREKFFKIEEKKEIGERRDHSLVKEAKIILEDMCYGCHLEFDLNQRTFNYKNTDIPYLEINHVISFSNNNVDNLDNLVKLCPPCHKALSPNRADEYIQKKIIKNMILNSDKASKFIEIFIDDKMIEKKIDYVYSKLR